MRCICVIFCLGFRLVLTATRSPPMPSTTLESTESTTTEGSSHRGWLCLPFCPAMDVLDYQHAFLTALCEMSRCGVSVSGTLPSGSTDTCRDANSLIRGLNSGWEEGDNWCYCAYPESHLYFWDGTNPSDAEKYCELNGCRAPGNSRLLQNGERFENNNGHPCECLRGSNPNLADASTRFHAKCVNGPGDRDYYYMDWFHSR